MRWTLACALFVLGLVCGAGSATAQSLGVFGYGGLVAGDSEPELELGQSGVLGVGVALDVGSFGLRLGVHRGGLLEDRAGEGAGDEFGLVERPLFGTNLDALYNLDFGVLRLGVGGRMVAEWRSHEFARNGGHILDDRYDKKLVILGAGPTLHAELPLGSLLSLYGAAHARGLFDDEVTVETGVDVGIVLRVF